MKTLEDSLSIAFLASSLLGLQVLLTDKWLWSAAPSHAYGLVGFVVLDLLLIAMVWIRRDLAVMGAALVSTLQFGAMLADLLIGQPAGVPSIAFRSYLLGDMPYVGLLIAQGATMINTVGAMIVPRVGKHPRGHSRMFSRN